MFTFYEFFAGGGMARLGLGSRWECLFANDLDWKKAASYRKNFSGAPELKVADVAMLSPKHLPGRADLIWASFPCQDLSLAGAGAGLDGDRSGAFWPFWRLVKQLVRQDRKPPLIVLENVCGALTSHKGRDFGAIGKEFSDAGYRFGAMVIDAANFVPQSRPRLFIVGLSSDLAVNGAVISDRPNPLLHSASLVSAMKVLPSHAREKWLWWNLAPPPPRKSIFADLIENEPIDVDWDTLEDTRRILSMMSPLNLAKVQGAQMKRRRLVGAVYRRTRWDEFGSKVQRAEVRFDDVAGCLRTPGGGSSRQRILIVHGGKIRSRLLSAREAARLMGLPEDYILPNRYNDAYHLIGDGVAVPVVRYLAEELLTPLLRAGVRKRAA